MEAIRRCLSKIDRKKAFQMAIGIIGINISFILIGIVYEKITNKQYLNNRTGAMQFFRSGAGFAMIQRGTNWILADIYKCFCVPKQKRVKIPWKNSAITASTIYLSIVAQTEAMFLVSYPFIIMAKSCSLISVILVGVLCSRVRNKQLKLGPNKIIIGFVVSIGIICFKLFDPSFNLQDNRKTEIAGFVLLLMSLFADGFTPDFQAQIKEKYKPQPIIMLIEINKWITIICAFHLIVTGQLINLFVFFYEHPECTIDMLIISLASQIGQIFVYRMIRQFKQHIVPFVVTTRKIITVALSLIYFHHSTSIGQIVSIVVVFAATLYEFLQNVTKSPAAILAQGPKQLMQTPKNPIDTSSSNDFSQLNQQQQNDKSKSISQNPIEQEKYFYSQKNKDTAGDKQQIQQDDENKN